MIFAALRSLASLRELRLAHQSRKKARSRQARQTERHCVMLKQHFSRGALVARLAVAILLVSPAALAQKRDAFRIDYTVSIASVEDQIFHITTDVKNINEPRLELSLPTWTPGWYTVENYFKNVLRFKITDAKGNRLQAEMIRKQTWRV